MNLSLLKRKHNTPKYKKRIFVGIYEIGDFTLRLSQGMRYWGFQVNNVVLEPKSPLLERKQGHDRYIQRHRNKYVFIFRLISEFFRQIIRNDIFVFNFCESFTGYVLSFKRLKWLHHLAYIDLSILKAFGKKIAIIVNGDDLRSRRLLVKEVELAGMTQQAKYMVADLDMDVGGTDEVMQKKAARIEKYADHIFARPNSVQFLTRDYHLVWVPIDLSTVEFSINKTDYPFIIHAPSDSGVKGTEYVLQAVDKLKSEGHKFKFELYQNISNEKLRKMLSTAHIAIDQLIIPGYGLFAIEAMASGCAVLGSAIPGYNGNPMELPIMTTTPDTIYRNLKLLIENYNLRIKMAQCGRTYVEKYHDHIKVARDFLQQIGERC